MSPSRCILLLTTAAALAAASTASALYRADHDCGRFLNKRKKVDQRVVEELYRKSDDAAEKLEILRDGYVCLTPDKPPARKPASDAFDRGTQKGGGTRTQEFGEVESDDPAPAAAEEELPDPESTGELGVLGTTIAIAQREFDDALLAAGSSRLALWQAQSAFETYELLVADPARVTAGDGTVPVSEEGKALIGSQAAPRFSSLRQQTLESFWDHFNAALTINMGRRRTIEDADLATVTDPLGQTQQVVQIDKADSYKARMGLEAHLYFWGKTIGNKSGSFSMGINAGPYINLGMGGLDVVDSFGAGILVGLLGNGKVDPTSGKYYMNLGLGWFIDPNCVDVQSGFRNGEPPPQGEPAVRLKNVTDHGPQVLLSFGIRLPTDSGRGEARK